MSAMVQDQGRLDKKVARLLLKQPKDAGINDVKKVARALYRGLKTPISSGLLLALDRGEIDTLATTSVDPRSYQTADEFYVDACASSFLSKFSELALMGQSSLDPKAAALESFFQAESQCKSTNERLEAYVAGYVSPTNPEVERVIARAKGFIKSVLPPVPKLEDIEVKFGPGSTSQCSGDSVTLADKLVAYPEMTIGSRHLVDVVKNSPFWFDLIAKVHPRCLHKARYVTDDFGDVHLIGTIAPKLVPGNRFVLVPKNAKTHRGICIEPHTLSCIQLCVGSILSQVLGNIGITKEVAQMVHGRLAREASLGRGLCTIDLKAASDTIAWELVKLLLPTDWFEFLASLRCDNTLVEGEWIEVEKFSSMGNGFTFELETLVFYALSRAASDLVDGPYQSTVAVFGDDIITSSASSKLLLDSFNFLGFTVNQSKTFIGNDGFNESCGQDFFKGVAVRPFFLKDPPCYVTDWYGVCNGIWAMATKSGTEVFDDRFRSAWLTALGAIPLQLRYHGPHTMGNAVIHDYDRNRWTIKTRLRGRKRIRMVRSDGVAEHVDVPRDDNIVRIRGLRPVTQKRSMQRW